jgi:hypothetical protein
MKLTALSTTDHAGTLTLDIRNDRAKTMLTSSQVVSAASCSSSNLLLVWSAAAMMINIDMEVDEEVVSRMGCMAYWAYGSCLHDVAECLSGTHIWNDDIALEKEFDEVRGEGNLPLYSLDALQANLTL